MAFSSGLCCTPTPTSRATGLPRLSSPSASASGPASLSFGLDRRPSSCGLRASPGRRNAGLGKSFQRLSLIRAEAGQVELAAPPTPPNTPMKKKSQVSAKPGRKQRVVLRFLWLEKNIGISLDQVIPGHGTVPLSPYFFWPRKDAWEELKAKLDSKKWISRKTTIILLNQATDIINLWQQNATNLL